MKGYKSDVNCNEPFPRRLQELMDERKVTQQALASFVKVKRQTISAYARGEVEPPLKSLVAMADFFQISLDNLAGKAECETPENEEIHKRLGLSDGAIKKLDEYYHSTSLPSLERARPTIISALIETNEGKELLDSISRYACADLSRIDDHDADMPSENGIRYMQFNAGQATPLKGTGFMMSTENLGAVCILDINDKLKGFREVIQSGQYGTP